MKYLYHGSSVSNLKVIKPIESGYNERYVYAVSELVFAAIFSVKGRNSLVARWGRDEEGIPYFCERGEGIFDSLYEGKKTSIYQLNSKNFFQNENMWKEEYVSKKEESIIEEIRVKDVKEFLLDLERRGKFELIRYKNRKKYFPNIDNEIVDDVNKLIEKYGKEKILPVVKRWRPDIYEEVNSRFG